MHGKRGLPPCDPRRYRDHHVGRVATQSAVVIDDDVIEPELQLTTLEAAKKPITEERDEVERLQALGIRCVLPEASYLMWMDCSDVLPQGTDAYEFFLDAGVALTGGEPFGGTPGTARLNFGCRRQTLEAGLDRVESALKRLES